MCECRDRWQDVMMKMEHRLIETEKKVPKGHVKIMLTVAAALLVIAIVLLNVFTHLMPVVRYYGDGMEPSLKNGQVLFVAKTDKVSKGDIIAFYYNNKVLIRRVIGTGGDEIQIEKDGSVLVNGKATEEPYLTGKSIGLCNLNFPHYVSPNHVFVMGDNRAIAMDSRLEEIGDISTDRIIGKILFVK